MSLVNRKCDNCGKNYLADMRNLKRGWGKCCSKSCAASKREKSRPNYNAKRVTINNFRRKNWNNRVLDSNGYGDYTGRRTSEGYKIYGDMAVNEYDEPVYSVNGGDGCDDPGDSEYWDNKDY